MALTDRTRTMCAARRTGVGARIVIDDGSRRSLRRQSEGPADNWSEHGAFARNTQKSPERGCTSFPQGRPGRLIIVGPDQRADRAQFFLLQFFFGVT